MKCIGKILFSSFRKCYGLLGSELPLARSQSLKIQGFGIFLLPSSSFYISTLNISRTVTSKPHNHTFFWKNLIRSFMCSKIFCLNCDWCFAVISRKYKKWAIFDIFVTVTLTVNMIDRQMIPAFSSTLWAISVGIFYFCISSSWKFNFT